MVEHAPICLESDEGKQFREQAIKDMNEKFGTSFFYGLGTDYDWLEEILADYMVR